MLDKSAAIYLLNLCSGNSPLAISASAKHAYLVSFQSGLVKSSKIVTTAINLSKADEATQASFAADCEDPTVHVASNAVAPALIWTDKSFRILRFNLLGTSQVSSASITSSGKEEIEEVTVSSPALTHDLPYFLIRFQTAQSHWAEVFQAKPSSKSISKVYELPQVGGPGAFSASVAGGKIYFTRNTDFEVSLTSTDSVKILEQWPIRPKSHGGILDPEGVSHAVSEVVPKAASGFAVRSAVVLSSGNWVMIRNGEPAWIRQESLSGIVAAAFAENPNVQDLAEQLAIESHDNLVSAYLHRVKRHANDLKQFPSWLMNIPTRVLSSFTGDSVDLSGPNSQSEAFDFRKLVVVATENGRVMALDTGLQGNVVWSTQAVKLLSGAKWKVHNINIGSKTAGISAAGGEYVIVELSTGKVLKYQPGGIVANLDHFLSVPEDAEKAPMILIKQDGSVEEAPADSSINAHVIVTRRPSGSIAGWSSSKGKRTLAWEFSAGIDETIVSVETRPLHDPVASIGKVLGDRKVLYKYLNPNLLLISAINPTSFSASIYLLDSISGQILYTTKHYGVDVDKPIAMAFTQNWFSYSLFSDPSIPIATSADDALPLPKSYQLIVSEIYESPIANDRGPLGSAENFSSLSYNAAFLTYPHVYTQAYVLPGPISQMTTTSTLQGITPPSLLCVLPTLNALIAIPMALLSARRPVGRPPNAQEMEEGLIQYQPLINFDPKWMINHKRELLNLKGIVTEATGMESTSLVFAWGETDVFGTKVAPIGEFDILGRGFGKLQLVGTVLALGAGTGILSPMVSNSCQRDDDGLSYPVSRLTRNLGAA